MPQRPASERQVSGSHQSSYANSLPGNAGGGAQPPFALPLKMPLLSRARDAFKIEREHEDESFLSYFFRVTSRGSTVWTEFRAGFLTFISVCYVMFVVPVIFRPVSVFSPSFLPSFLPSFNQYTPIYDQDEEFTLLLNSDLPNYTSISILIKRRG